MAAARWRITSNPCSIESIPAATMAAYSPREWPATAMGSTPCSFTAASAARLVAKMAGWLTLVWAKKASSPSKQAAARSNPSTSEPHSNTLAEAGRRAASSLPIPLYWDP